MNRIKKHFEVVLTDRTNLHEHTVARCNSLAEARGLAKELLLCNPLRPVRAWVRQVGGRA